MYIRDIKTGYALIAPKEELDYFSQDSCIIQKNINAFDAYCTMTSSPPLWLKLAFTVRDKISALAGVKTIDGFSGACSKTPQQGDKLDFFDVLEHTKDELIVTAIDKHLGVLVSIQTHCKQSTTLVTVTASVKNKNFFGKLYMIPVKPAHEFIVRNMLKKLL